jgi:trk system potassium uptake protein
MYVIVAGGGKIGSYLASLMVEAQNEVAVIERQERLCNTIADVLDDCALVIEGDCCETRILQDAGAENADVFVASTGQDETNLIACELVQRIFNVPRVVARVNSPKNLRIFRDLGIECVSGTSLIGSLILEEALYGSVSITSSLTHGDVILSEYTIGHMKNFDDEEGIRLGEIDLPNSARFVAIEFEDDAEVADEDMVLHPGDQVIVVSDRDLIPEIRSIFKSL